MVLNTKQLSRFWSKVNKTQTCWLWTACVNTYGYGCITIEYTMYQAHRVSYELEYGRVPNGQSVLHKCDTPRCVNPTHLFLGTQADNMRDRSIKGRQPRKLSSQDVATLRELSLNSHWTVKDLAARFRVSVVTIRDTLSGKYHKY
jgi:hypothetical protein